MRFFSGIYYYDYDLLDSVIWIVTADDDDELADAVITMRFELKLKIVIGLFVCYGVCARLLINIMRGEFHRVHYTNVVLSLALLFS